MSYKDFDAMLREKLGGRPDFVVGGQKFTARAKLPWRKFSHLLLTLTGEDTSSSSGIDKTEEFFRLVIIPKDRDRFFALLHNEGDDDEDDENVIDPQQVSELLDWLLEYYTGGKAEKSDDSSLVSPPTTGQPANVISTSLNPLV